MRTRHAPAVSYTLGRSRFLARLWWLAWLAGLGVNLAWVQLADAGDPGPWLGVLAVVLCGLWAAWSWQRLPSGRLSWDGQTWVWLSASYPAGTRVTHLAPVLDLQRLLLIRMRNPAGVPWMVWADAATEPGHWLDFRRAIYAHRVDAQDDPDPSRPDASP